MGCTLPAAYIDLLRVQNGGFLKPNTVQLGNDEFTGVGMLYGLGSCDGIDAEQDGKIRNVFLHEQWGYSESSLVICHDRHGGFALLLNSEDSGVIYCDAER